MDRVTVLIRWTIPEGKESEVLTIIARMRGRAAEAKGYVSSEIAESENDYVSVCKWLNAAFWKAWRESQLCRELQKKLDALGCLTSYEVLQYPDPDRRKTERRVARDMSYKGPERRKSADRRSRRLGQVR